MKSPYRAYDEMTATRIADVINLAKLMAVEHYPHLLSRIEFTEKRMKETEVLFDKSISELKKR
ncbi:MAG: hypothetical protein IIW42_05810 [Bacteroidaceae bacterium]|nr:hypothetical protein [Bacteroidaceae bacterium]